MFHHRLAYFDGSRAPRSRRSFFLLALILAICLAATAPAFAADPEEADPDPEQPATGNPFSPTRLLILGDLSELDPATLEPGRYIVRIVDRKGTQEVFEIVVGPR